MKKRSILLSLCVGVLAATGFSFVLANSHGKEATIKEVSAETDYYDGCDGLTGNQLKNKLKTIISKGISTNYDWSRFEAADEDPNNDKNIVTIYARSSLAKNDHVHSGNIGWNREHTFPQSKMDVSASKSDNHIIFASDAKVNGARGNHRLGELTSGEYIKDSYGNTTTCRLVNDVFDPGDTIARGLVARSTMYASVLYGYDIDDNITSYAKCLEWHFKYYPTETWDIRRNDIVYSNQKNRNPFVDHPEYAAYIWGDHDAECQKICEQYMSSLESLSVSGTPTKTAYKEGEKFDPTGLTITAYFSNDTERDVTSSVTWSPSPLTAGTTSVKGTYTQNSVTKEVTVNGITVASATGISYTGSPTKKTYYDGDTFNPNGCSFFLEFSDSSKVSLPASSITWAPLKAGQTSATGTYGSLTVSVTGITVNEVVVTSLSLSGTPAKVAYVESETFDPTGLTITANYNNGGRQNVTTSVVWTPNPLAANTVEVVGTYQGLTVKVAITVSEKPKKPSGGCKASITSNSSIVFISSIILVVFAIKKAIKSRKEN